MRPAGVLAKAVTKFESDVTIVFEDKKINAKSLLNIIGACIKCGSEIELVCEGPDEEAALAHATELIESGLGEQSLLIMGVTYNLIKDGWQHV